jgi:methyl-accepting chemotaxis protein
MRLSNIPIGKRLALGFGSVIVIMLAMVGLALLKMATVKDDMRLFAEDKVVRERLAQTMSEQAHIAARVMRTMVMLNDLEKVNGEYPKIVKARAEYEAAARKLAALAGTDDERRALQAVADAAATAMRIDDDVLALARENRDAEATQLVFAQSIPANKRWQDALDGFIDTAMVDSQAAYEAALRADLQARWILVISAALGLAVACGAAWLITRSVLNPILYLREAALRMAHGDLTVPVERRRGFDGTDETSQLVAAMQTMHDSLVRLVAEVHANAAAVAAAAHQISQGNADLSSRTEQQASSLQQTAASMEEFTASVRNNADNATSANALAAGASDAVTRSGGVMSELVSSMRGIHDSSRKIEEIISVIDSIAFQTNILALNAAVEAARAGEQGRGFAVVAAEVRNLAQRSATAAREIKGLIADSVTRVSTGTQLVERAGGSFGELVQSIRQVSGLVAEITSASREQANGIAQVSTAVSQMDQVTQQNAALVEEAAAAAQSLNEQAQKLVASVSRFQLAA